MSASKPIFVFFILLVSCHLTELPAAEVAKLPNIILIVADHLGDSLKEVTGSGLRQPGLDSENP
jgi:hypothetical protein